MKAMIFAAGLGTRLKPFTLEHPKALVPVGGIPMLERVMRKLIGAGANDIVVNVHHFADQIVDFISHGDWGDTRITISDESGLLLDTGGGLLNARKWLENTNAPIIVHNADILTDFDLCKMINCHLEKSPLATLLVKKRETTRYIAFDNDMLMKGWTNVASGERKPADLQYDDYNLYAFGGVHLISPKIFQLLKQFAKGQAVFSIMSFYISACHSHRIIGYAPAEPYHWYDVGKPSTLALAEKEIFVEK